LERVAVILTSTEARKHSVAPTAPGLAGLEAVIDQF
jgi:hypothetical protein